MFTNRNCTNRIWKYYPELFDKKPIRYDMVLFDTGFGVDYNYRFIINYGPYGFYYNTITVFFNRKMSCDLYNVFDDVKYARLIEKIFQFKSNDICEFDIFNGVPIKIKPEGDLLISYIKNYFYEFNCVGKTLFLYCVTNTTKTKNIIDYLEMKNVCGGHF